MEKIERGQGPDKGAEETGASALESTGASTLESMGESAEADVDATLARFLVARIGQRLFAFPAEAVREIVTDVPIYFVPFVPPYIRGIINRLGEPYTVCDLHALFEKRNLDARAFVISRGEDDAMAFLISEVAEMLKVTRDKVRPLSTKEGELSYFSGMVAAGSGNIPVVAIKSLLDKLAHDLRE